MRYLITGGAGFIGSHLAEALLARGDEVFILDDLSTGSVENIRHLKAHERFHYFFDSITNKHLLAELVDESDVVFHLAAAVGVRLIVESPVRTIETNVYGTQLVLDAASKKKKLVFTASTSEVYGKSDKVPFRRRCRSGAWPDDQGPLELRRLEGARRISGALLLEGKEAAGDRRALFQYGGAAPDRALRHGAAEFRAAGAGRRAHYGLRHGQAVALLLRRAGYD